jgi:ketosteroid isomerase-like protein
MSKGLHDWHAAVKAKRPEDILPLLADDAVFESPIVHKPQHGKALTAMYLQGALQVLNNDSFRYLNEWHAPGSAVLEFQTEIDGITVNGVDLITWNSEGLITHFKVMVRPLKAINLVHQKMGAMLETLKAG